jgi:hypothetical protein
MPLVPTKRRVATTQGERTDDYSTSSGTQNQTRLDTPGLETTTQIEPLSTETSTVRAAEFTTRTTETPGLQTTTENKGIAVGRKTSPAHTVRNISGAAENTTTQQEDAAMTIRFKIRINSMNAGTC